jgi:hypothetical protein
MIMEDNKKKIKKLRGSATMHDDGNFTFTPFAEGEPQREVMKRSGDSSLCRTQGEKRQSVIAHLKVPADSKDYVADLYDALGKLTKDQQTSMKSPTPKGRILEANDDYRLTLSNKEGKLFLSLAIDLAKDADFMKKFNDLTYRISQCLYYNETSVRQLCRALATSSSK